MALPAATKYFTSEITSWAALSRISYGDESYASTIKAANPVVFEPIAVGLWLTIPLLPLAPPGTPGPAVEPDVPQPGRVGSVPFNDPDDVTLLINGKTLRNWESVSITKNVDTFSTVTFTAPFESTDPALKALLQPLSFALIQLFVGGRPYFFGRMLPVAPTVDADSRTVDVSCYSYPGTLNDCTLPYGAKAQFLGIDLFEITRQIVKPFAINVIEPFTYDLFDPLNPDPFNEASYYNVFKDTSIKVGKKILKYLIDLAEQRKLVITDNANGDLVYSRVKQTGQPVAHLVEGRSPLTNISIDFKTQDWYSDVTGVASSSVKSGVISSYLKGNPGEDPLTAFTVNNKFLIGVYRPYVFKVKDTDGDVKDAVESKFARMLSNVVTYSVDVVGWRDPNGVLWAPNTLIDITYPSAMIYQKYRFLIKSVKLSKDEDKKVTSMVLCLPGSFTGTAPSTLPWQ